MIKKTAKVALISDEPSGSSYRRQEAKNDNEQAPGTVSVESDAAEKNNRKALSTSMAGAATPADEYPPNFCTDDLGLPRGVANPGRGCQANIIVRRGLPGKYHCLDG
jgi:hypothetical protein